MLEAAAKALGARSFEATADEDTASVKLFLVVRAMFDEALRRDPEKRRRWVVLVDGEPRQLRAVKAEARRAGVKVTILLDVVHVLEYVWKGARASGLVVTLLGSMDAETAP